MACLEAGDGEEGVAIDDEEQSVWEPLKYGSVDIFVDDRKLVWVRTHTLYKRINSFAESSPQPADSGFVPVLRLDQFEASELGERWLNPILRTTIFQFGLEGCPCYATLAAIIE